MKHLLVAISLALSACSATLPVDPIASIPAPSSFANRTAADEQIAIGVEQGYKAFRMALTLGVDTGVIKGERATKARAANVAAYRGVVIMREAYKTANSEDFLNAARSANSTIAGAIELVRNR